MPPTEKNINELQNKLWYIIRHEEIPGSNTNPQHFINTNEDYQICLNDIVKLGRVKYSANEINFLNNESQGNDSKEINKEDYNLSLSNQGTKPVFDFIYKTNIPTLTEMDDVMCKICLSNGSDEQNPLVELCKCTGGIKFSHYECLKRWMQTKLSKKENEKQCVTSYNIKAFNCEICKTPYPCKIINLMFFSPVFNYWKRR